jgi:glucose/arabinose dehydrogenase
MRRQRAVSAALALCGSALLAGAASASAASLEPVGGSFTQPTFVTADPADENRIFVVEQDGRIQLVSGGATSVFLDIDSLVLSAGETGGGNEQGLLSMAFAPDFQVSGRFYVFFTASENGAGDLTVAELTASGDSADPATLRPVITIPHTGTAQNHNGGQLQFGPDGMLYISTGDGGTGGAQAQNTGTLLGKLLRIAPTPGGGYAVPGDNPFVGVSGYRPEIWSLGLRNPWRFSFDRLTGDLVLADVGQGTWEEVNFSAAPAAARGLNFGWPCREGPDPRTGCAGTFTDPNFWYQNQDPAPCAVTGGYVVRDAGLEELYGRYLYADFCVGELRSHELSNPFATDRSEGLNTSLVTTFGEDRCGRVYVASRNGPVFRLTDGTPAECPPPPELPVPDVTGPALTLEVERKHDVERRRRVPLTATSDESGALDLGATVTKGGREKELFALDSLAASLEAGAPTQLKLALTRRQARRCERLIDRGNRIEVQVGGTATDGAGNQGPPAEAEVRLVLD